MLWLACILGVLVAAVTFLCMGALLRMFILRHDFEIAARSPQIMLLAGFFAYVMVVAVLLQWFLVNVGSSLPCWVVIWISYAGEPSVHATQKSTCKPIIRSVTFSATHGGGSVRWGGRRVRCRHVGST